METKVLNYRVIIETDKRLGTEEAGYSAYCPTLDVASEGETIEETLKNIAEALECRLGALAKDKVPIPIPDNPEETIITYSHVQVPENFKFNFA